MCFFFVFTFILSHFFFSRTCLEGLKYNYHDCIFYMILYDFFFSRTCTTSTTYIHKKKRKKDDDVYFAPNQVSLVPFSQKLLYESIIIIIIIMIMLLRQRKTTEDKSCQFDVRQGKITFCSIEFRRVLCLLLIFGITYIQGKRKFFGMLPII